jgi:hypothetical protein
LTLLANPLAQLTASPMLQTTCVVDPLGKENISTQLPASQTALFTHCSVILHDAFTASCAVHFCKLEQNDPGTQSAEERHELPSEVPWQTLDAHEFEIQSMSVVQ